MAPLVSIITVTRNDAGGLRATGLSVAEQTMVDFEWIVADGVSTDETLTMLQDWQHCPVRVHSAPDSSIYDGMNNGAALATGTWLYFLNAGDVFAEATSLQRMDPILRSTPRSWGFAAVRQIRSDGTGFTVHCASPYDANGLALGNTTIPHQGTFVRRDLFESLGGFLIDFGTEEDQEFLYRASLTGPPFEEVWPIADMRMGGTGWNGSTGHLARAMYRARRLAGRRVGGNRLVDLVATAGVLTSAYWTQAESRVARWLQADAAAS
jgi:glycosyltransferase involved in cell wall biosynthesis